MGIFTDNGPDEVEQIGQPSSAPRGTSKGIFSGGDDVEPIDTKPEEKFEPKVVADSHRPTPSTDDDLSLADALSQGAHNFIPSSGKALKETAEAVTTKLPQTLEGMKQVGKGALSKVAGMVGVDQDPAEKAKTESVIDALGKHYKDTYTNWGGFKHAIASDPASVLMDLSTPVSGGLGSAAKVAGTASKVGKALEVASKAVRYADPVSATLGAAGQVAKVPNAIAKNVASVTARVPKSALDIAESAGKTGDQGLRDAFMRHYTGSGDSQEIFDAAQGALESIKKKNSADYMATKNGLAANATKPDYSGIQAAVDALPQDINGGNAGFAPIMANGAPTGRYSVTGVPPHHFDGANEVAAKIKGLVESYASDPQRQNFMELDRLKQAIHDATISAGFRPDSSE